MAFDKSSIIQQNIDILVRDLVGEPGSLLDEVFPNTKVDRRGYALDVMPASQLPKSKGKLADGADAQPRPAKLASIQGHITGRYEGSYSFTEGERRELEGSNVRMEEYTRQAKVDCDFDVDLDLHSALTNASNFQSISRSGVAYTDPAAPILDDLAALKNALGRRKDLIVIMGQDVADAIRQLDDMKARMSNFAAGDISEDELVQAIKGKGFADLYIPNSLGKEEADGVAGTPTLKYSFDGLFWVGRRDAIHNVELGDAVGRFGEDVSSSSYLLKYERYLDIKAVLESKLGGAFVPSPLG